MLVVGMAAGTQVVSCGVLFLYVCMCVLLTAVAWSRALAVLTAYRVSEGGLCCRRDRKVVSVVYGTYILSRGLWFRLRRTQRYFTPESLACFECCAFLQVGHLARATRFEGLRRDALCIVS